MPGSQLAFGPPRPGFFRPRVPVPLEASEPEPAVHQGALSASGIALLLALTFTWGLNWPMMKLALLEVPPWTFRTLCLMVGGSALLALARATGGRIGIPLERVPALALVSVFNITCWHLLSAYALLNTGSGRAAIIGYTMPLWASLLSVLVLSAKLTLRQESR